jgi:hypothetical protein
MKPPDNWDDDLDVTDKLDDSNLEVTTTPVNMVIPARQPITISIDGHTPYQPQVKIISRKNQDSSSASEARAIDINDSSQSLEERQRRYQEVRSRIFGESELKKTKMMTNKRPS